MVPDAATEHQATVTKRKPSEEAPEPNPVAQIIATRTLQTLLVAFPVLIGLRAVLPPKRFRCLLRWGGPLVTAALSGYFAATFHARSPLFSRLSGKENEFVTHLPPDAGKAVALTFDDGPHPETTPYLLDVLKQYGAKATFFLVGERVSRWPEIVRRIADEGHAIGIHGLRHRTMVLQAPAQVRKDIGESVRRTETATGKQLPFPYLLRPPYGFKTPTLGRTAGALGCRIIAWSVDPRDYDGISADCLVKRLAREIAPGSIVLLHESPKSDLAARSLPGILRLCRERGLDCCPLALENEPDNCYA